MDAEVCLGCMLELLQEFGPGALMAKLDIESVFRLLPLHLE